MLKVLFFLKSRTFRDYFNLYLVVSRFTQMLRMRFDEEKRNRQFRGSNEEFLYVQIFSGIN